MLTRRAPNGDTTLVTELEVPPSELTGSQRATLDTILGDPRWPVDASALGMGPQYLRSFSADEDGNLLVRSNLAEDTFEMFDARARLQLPSGLPQVVGAVVELPIPQVVLRQCRCPHPESA